MHHGCIHRLCNFSPCSGFRVSRQCTFSVYINFSMNLYLWSKALRHLCWQPHHVHALENADKMKCGRPTCTWELVDNVLGTSQELPVCSRLQCSVTCVTYQSQVRRQKNTNIAVSILCIYFHLFTYIQCINDIHYAASCFSTKYLLPLLSLLTDPKYAVVPSCLFSFFNPRVRR